MRLSITNRDDFFQKFGDHWYNIDREMCRRLIRSMPRRIEAVIKANGGPTRY